MDFEDFGGFRLAVIGLAYSEKEKNIRKKIKYKRYKVKLGS